MLGSGRPFLIEVLNARHVPGEEDVKDIERRINDSENQLVKFVAVLYFIFVIL